jgi:hypothetical protein
LTAWEELLDEFRALGGTAENIRLGHGEFGRGIFPVDPNKPVAIHIPDNLLISPDDMVLTNGMLRVGPNSVAGDREKAWLNRYQEEYGWGGGGADQIRQNFEMAGALPAELRHALSEKYRCGFWFEEPTEALIRYQFFNSRILDYKGRPVVIPIIELANHGVGAGYDPSDGVALRGTFPGEVFVEYAHLDSYDFFLSWGFATQRPVAFSMALTGIIQSTRLDIGQLFDGITSSERDWIPKIEKTSDSVGLPFLMIGNQRYPRLPKGIFYRLMRDAGYAGFEESFDLIHHLNRMHFIDLLATLDGIELPLAKTLRAMAQYQLRAMSNCWGVREI